MTTIQQILVAAFYTALLSLCVQSLARLPLLIASRNTKTRRPDTHHVDGDPPEARGEGSGFHAEPAQILVQLPIFNEPAVCERLILAAAKMEPREQIDVQIVDDSTDDTPTVVEQVLATLSDADRKRFSHLRRTERVGFKAGALQNGLRRSGHPFVAIFDADFVPSRQLLAGGLVHFRDDEVGMVQFAWTWMNRNQSLWTRAQAALLDAHFSIDQPGRARLKLPFNFNGTAGIWRREAIETSGGWQHDTITEDLDLSYRAQIHGWKFVYAGYPGVLSELPATASAYRSQQHRWAKGGAQTARKLRQTITESKLDAPKKLSAFIHLNANTNYLLTVFAAVLLPFVIHAHHLLPPWFTWAIDLPLVTVGACLTWLGYWIVERRRGASQRRALVDAALGAMLDTGIAAHKARGVLEAWAGIRSPFVRTPKTGNAPQAARPTVRLPWVELTLAAWLGYAIWTTATSFTVSLLGVPFLLWFFVSFLWVAMASVTETLAALRGAAGRELKPVAALPADHRPSEPGPDA